MWRSAKDDRGRTYYYHVKLRQPQWTPPPPPPDEAGTYLRPATPTVEPSVDREVTKPSSTEESSSEEEQPQRAPRPLRAPGRLVEGLHGVYEGACTA